MAGDTDVWFEVGNTGNILFTLDGHVIGAIRKTDFCVLIDHDDEVLRKFREGVVELYRELPDLEQVVMNRLAEVALTKTREGPVARFMRALMPLSNLDFDRAHFDQPEAMPSGYIGKQRKRSEVLHREAKCLAEVIPFPGKLAEKR